MTNPRPSARAFLDAAYSQLNFLDGELLEATDKPQSNLTPEQWIDKGDWLSLAKKVNAEKIFFVENSPVIVLRRNS